MPRLLHHISARYRVKHGTAPVLALMTLKRGLFLAFSSLRGIRNGGICRILAILHVARGGTLALAVYFPCTMVREIFLRSRSTFSTHTFTVSPTRTTSLGCLTKRLASLEMCTRPS